MFYVGVIKSISSIILTGSKENYYRSIALVILDLSEANKYKLNSNFHIIH